jgi:hypothetical protein
MQVNGHGYAGTFELVTPIEMLARTAKRYAFAVEYPRVPLRIDHGDSCPKETLMT